MRVLCVATDEDVLPTAVHYDGPCIAAILCSSLSSWRESVESSLSGETLKSSLRVFHTHRASVVPPLLDSAVALSAVAFAAASSRRAAHRDSAEPTRTTVPAERPFSRCSSDTPP